MYRQSDRDLATLAVAILLIFSIGTFMSLYLANWYIGPWFMILTLLFCAVIHLVQRNYSKSSLTRRMKYSHPILLGLLIALPLFSLAAQATILPDATDRFGRSSFEYTGKLYIVNLLWLLSGMAIAPAIIRKSNFLAIAILASLGFAVFSAAGDRFIISYEDVQFQLTENAVNHLTTSTAVAISLAYAYSVSTGVVRTASCIVGLLLLFAIGGRSALVLLPLSMIIYEATINRKKRRSAITLLILGGGLLVLLQPYIDALSQDNVLLQRMIFAEGLETDRSFGGRLKQLEGGLRDLPGQAAFGNPGLLIANFDSLGTYIHNILSAWQFFGMGFFVVLSLAIYRCVGIAYNARHQGHKPTITFFSTLLYYSVLESLFAKAINFGILWLALGVWLTIRISQSRKTVYNATTCPNPT